VRACQSVDTAVHPDHRGQRIFEGTASDCYAWCASQGLEAVFEKDRQRFSHAPLVIVVVASPRPDPKVPEQEQLMTAGCVCFALLQAAQALGFGAQWLTAWMAFDPVVQAHLGLVEGERIAGFIHIGTAKADVPERERPDPATLLQDWTPPA